MCMCVCACVYVFTGCGFERVRVLRVWCERGHECAHLREIDASGETLEHIPGT